MDEKHPLAKTTHTKSCQISGKMQNNLERIFEEEKNNARKSVLENGRL